VLCGQRQDAGMQSIPEALISFNSRHEDYAVFLKMFAALRSAVK
jgi:hypothetical protein